MPSDIEYSLLDWHTLRSTDRVENQIVKYLAGILIEESKLIQHLQLDITQLETVDNPQLNAFSKKMLEHANQSCEQLNELLLHMTGETFILPVCMDTTEEDDDDFFEIYNTRLSLLAISYDILNSNAQFCSLHTVATFAQENVDRLSKSLTDLLHLANGYQNVIALKELRIRLVSS